MLRHSFAATAAEMGFSELTIAGLLGHSVPGVTARYAHVPDSALVTAADRVAARIASALDGKAEAEVVPAAKREPTRNEMSPSSGTNPLSFGSRGASAAVQSAPA